MTALGFLHGLAVVYVVVIDDLNVSSAEAALMMSVTRGVMYGSGIDNFSFCHILEIVDCEEILTFRFKSSKMKVLKIFMSLAIDVCNVHIANLMS